MEMSFRERKRMEQTLHEVFHLPGFRPRQREAVMSLMNNKDVLCLFPTGSGKSLCYQLPAVLMSRPVLVISPLIALMRDQVEGLRKLGVSAACLDSMQGWVEQQDVMQSIAQGRVKVVYVSPERLHSSAFVQAVMQAPPQMVVVDEAHCIVAWGNDFRPAYGEIRQFVDRLPQRPVICAMTATADTVMREQIIQSLGMRTPEIITLPLFRENLSFHVITSFYPTETLLQACRQTGKTLIFCRTRARTEQIARLLNGLGLRASFYHAGLEREKRVAIQDQFASGQIGVLASTSAFGMGVDIPDIRRVVMDYLPENMADLMQQTGRAGRDCQAAQVLLMFDPMEIGRIRKDMERKQTEIAKGTTNQQKILKEARDKQQVLNVYLSDKCIPKEMAKAFGQKVDPCGQCSACMKRRNHRWAFPLRVPQVQQGTMEEITAWALQRERQELMHLCKLPFWGFTSIDVNESIRDGEIHCRGRWRGMPQQRLQNVLDHMQGRREVQEENKKTS